MSGRTEHAPRRWRVARWLIRWVLARAARRVLATRALADETGREIRWLRPEIYWFLGGLEAEAAALRPLARLDGLPSAGNRLMVELAVYTAASDRLMRRSGVAPAAARAAVSDIGWEVYRRMLALASLPFRVASRDPSRRLRWTIGALLVFPFDAPGAPGYAVERWTEDGDLHTHFTHCPPQSFVRRLSESEGDPEALEAFRASWCRYDWPGADIITSDGRRGHYRRRRTLSHGDAVCDMCWAARAVADRGGTSP